MVVDIIALSVSVVVKIVVGSEGTSFVNVATLSESVVCAAVKVCMVTTVTTLAVAVDIGDVDVGAACVHPSAFVVVCPAYSKPIRAQYAAREFFHPC